MLRRNLRTAARASWIVLLAALGSTSSAIAGTNQFTLLGPDGGHIHKVLFHPANPSIVFALTQGGYYRSTDSGLTWLPVGDQQFEFTPADMAVDPRNPDRILFAAPGELMLSANAGASLAEVLTFPLNPAGLSQVEFSADGMVVYVASGVRILRSTDGGVTWGERTPVTNAFASSLQFLHVDPLNADVVYVYDLNQGGFRSSNGGASWQPVPMPANTVDIAITSTTPQKIWAASTDTGVHLSTDGGASWPVAFGGPALSIALDPQNQSVVYAGTSAGGLVRTADGNAWANVQGNARIGQITTIAVNPQDPTKLMMGGQTGVVAGVPAQAGAGGVWESRNQGIRAMVAGDMSAPRGSSRIYINTFTAGVHFLADGAAATAPVNNAGMIPPAPATFLTTTFGLLAQARGADRVFVGISGGYVRSDDGGGNWQAGTLAIGSPDTVRYFADSPGNPDLIVASTFAGMHRSIDGGDSWLPANSGLPAQSQATALAFAPAAPNTIYAGIESVSGSCCTQHGVYKSTDGGVSWSAANTGLTSSNVRALAIDPANPEVVYAASNAVGLLKTTNGGAAWLGVTWPGGPANALAVAVDPQFPNIVYVGGFNRLARSVDAGLTWQELRPFAARPSWQANALLVDPRRASTLLMSTGTQGVAEITIAPNLVLEQGAIPFAATDPGLETYQYRLGNIGPFHATGVRTVVSLPAGTTDIAPTISNGSCVVQGTTVTCQTQVLEVAATANIVVTTTRPAPGSVQVLASVHGDQPDAQATNNEVTYTFTVAQPTSPPPPTSPTNPSGGGGGGGGGGTSSLLWILALAAMRLARSYARPRRFSTS